MEYFYFSSDFILIRYDELANLLVGMAMLLIGMTNLGMVLKLLVVVCLKKF